MEHDGARSEIVSHFAQFAALLALAIAIRWIVGPLGGDAADRSG